MPVRTTRALLAGRYRTIERVGSGGMATVLLAEDERLGRKVAVKRLHAESPEDTARRFRREARLGASLNHPNLVAVYDIVTDDEDVLIVMEYVDGETLRDALERAPLEPARAVEVLRGIAAALDHAHSEGIVHRDVKPANVLLGADGRVKLADLGIATAVEGTRMTMSGTVLGTASYMAPEQLEGSDPGPAADIYSLAVVAWESLCGCRAYEGKTPLEIAHRKAVEPPPSLLDSKPDAPPAAAEVLSRAMGADPAGRPPTASAFVEELAAALEPPRETAATTALGGNGHRPVPVAAPVPTPEPVPEPTALRAPVPVAAPAPPPASPPAADYARHTAHRGRPSWLLPLAALLVAVAVGAAALFALDGGSSSEPSQKSESSKSSPAKKKHRKHKKSQPTQQAPAPAPAAPAEEPPAQPAEPGQTDPGGSSGYELPQPSGSSASEGSKLNAQGKSLSDAGRYDDAIPVLERSVRAFPAGTDDINYAYALFNLGHALRLAGRPADAVVVLEERLKNPNQRSTVQHELDLARSEAASG